MWGTQPLLGQAAQLEGGTQLLEGQKDQSPAHAAPLSSYTQALASSAENIAASDLLLASRHSCLTSHLLPINSERVFISPGLTFHPPGWT